MTQVAQAFVKLYYTTFDTDRKQLGILYQPQSMWSFEGNNVQGAENIINKLTSLPFQQCAHAIKSVDVQPSSAPGGILVFACGDIKIDNSDNALKFAQTFHLLPTDNTMKNFFVMNDLFRLNYG